MSRILSLIVPRLVSRGFEKLIDFVDQRRNRLPTEFSELQFSGQCIFKLLKDFEFTSVLDVGSGSGKHAAIFCRHGKSVTALDFGTSIYADELKTKNDAVKYITADFNKFESDQKFDCIWLSHVLEHQPNAGDFIKKCIHLLNDDGVLAITVPPMEAAVCGGHLTTWNAGLILYNLVFNGLDCRNVSIYSYNYNVSVIVKKKLRDPVLLSYDNGDINRMLQYFPEFISTEPFDGNIKRWNW